MKKMILLNALVFIGLSLNGQGSPSNLDQLNGFKKFKYGDSPQKHIAYIKENKQLSGTKNSRFREFNSYDKDITTFGIEFKMATIYFIDNQLYKIKLSNWNDSIDVQIKKDMGASQDWELIVFELVKLFGKDCVFNKKEDMIETTFSEYWETVTNKLEFNVTAIFTGKFYMTLEFYNKKLTQKAEIAQYE